MALHAVYELCIIVGLLQWHLSVGVNLGVATLTQLPAVGPAVAAHPIPPTVRTPARLSIKAHESCLVRMLLSSAVSVVGISTDIKFGIVAIHKS